MACSITSRTNAYWFWEKKWDFAIGPWRKLIEMKIFARMNRYSIKTDLWIDIITIFILHLLTYWSIYFEGHLNSTSMSYESIYLVCLKIDLRHRMWLQHDDAHEKSIEMEYFLKNGCNGMAVSVGPWDHKILKSSIFFLWGYMKNIVSIEPPFCPKYMLLKTTNAFRSITSAVLGGMNGLSKYIIKASLSTFFKLFLLLSGL